MKNETTEIPSASATCTPDLNQQVSHENTSGDARGRGVPQTTKEEDDDMPTAFTAVCLAFLIPFLAVFGIGLAVCLIRMMFGDHAI